MGASFVCLALFILAYILVIFEEFLRLRKSKAMMVAAGAIWLVIAASYPNTYREALEKSFLDFSQLFFFLVVAMAFVHTLSERNVFAALQARLKGLRLSLRGLFWLSGGLAFVISPLLDNLTTALVLGSLVITLANHNRHFISLALINLVVAANAGGAFSPFGDITTLMVWQSGKVPFLDFFKLFVPCLLSFFIPALALQSAVPKNTLLSFDRSNIQKFKMKPGALGFCGFFLLPYW